MHDNPPITAADLRALEAYLDAVWSGLGVDVSFSRHFLDQVNDPRNVRQITIDELKKLFTETCKRHGKQLVRMYDGRDIEGVLKDVSSKINSPFVLSWDGNELDLVAKTVMRKKNFVPHSHGDKVFTIEQKIDRRLRRL